MAHTVLARHHADDVSVESSSTSNAESSILDNFSVSNNCSEECLTCLFRGQCVIKDLVHSDVGEFSLAVNHKRPLPKGGHLYRQGREFNSLYIVHSGAVKLYRISETGDEKVWGFHLPGEIIGTEGLYSHTYINSAVALDTTSVCELSLSRLEHLLSDQKSFCMAFLSRIYGEVLESQNMTVRSHKPSERQLAMFVVDLSSRFQRRQLPSSKFHFVMTRRDIASYLGLAVETVSRILTRFQEREWMTVDNREMTITNEPALETFAHHDTRVL
jgi:CRP/FNR family transcriptional regulator, anaerobic regulatory protein